MMISYGLENAAVKLPVSNGGEDWATIGHNILDSNKVKDVITYHARVGRTTEETALSERWW